MKNAKLKVMQIRVAFIRPNARARARGNCGIDIKISSSADCYNWVIRWMQNFLARENRCNAYPAFGKKHGQRKRSCNRLVIKFRNRLPCIPRRGRMTFPIFYETIRNSSTVLRFSSSARQTNDFTSTGRTMMILIWKLQLLARAQYDYRCTIHGRVNTLSAKKIDLPRARDKISSFPKKKRNATKRIHVGSLIKFQNRTSHRRCRTTIRILSSTEENRIPE